MVSLKLSTLSRACTEFEKTSCEIKLLKASGFCSIESRGPNKELVLQGEIYSRKNNAALTQCSV